MSRPRTRGTRTGGKTGLIIGLDGTKAARAVTTTDNLIKGASQIREAPVTIAEEAVVVRKTMVVPKRHARMKIGVPGMIGGMMVGHVDRIPEMGTEGIIGGMTPPGNRLTAGEDTEILPMGGTTPETGEEEALGSMMPESLMDVEI